MGIAACAPESEDGSSGPGEGETASEVERNFRPVVYERNVVVLTLGGDSTIVVPWVFGARNDGASVRHEIRGWLSRGDTWDAFFSDQWTTGPSRAPFRILPRGPVDLVVGAGDALEAILYEQGARRLETALETPIADWSGSRGESLQLHRGALLLGDGRLEARVLDLTRSHREDQVPPGDWIFLEGGPELNLILASADVGAGADASYSAWALHEDEELRWPTVRVIWEEMRPFEEARRDVPGAWRFVSDDGELIGTVVSVAAHLRAEPGDGPLLPVESLFRVRGSLEIRGDSLPVRGLVRHIQR